MPGSRNLIGIKNPAIDALIERVIFAKDRDELVAATKALDRVLLWNFYVVPQWTYGKQRTARWDRFSHPGQYAEIRPSRVPDDLVVGRGQGGQGAAAVVITRRQHACAIGGCDRRGEIHAAGGRARRRASRHVGFRRSRAIRPISRISTTSIRTRPRAACFRRSDRTAQFNQSFLTFNSLNSYILKGDGAQGMELTFATLMARVGRRARRHVRARRARRSHLRQRADLHVPAAPRGEIPRRHAADGA